MRDSELSKAFEGKKFLRLEGGFWCYLMVGSFVSAVAGFILIYFKWDHSVFLNLKITICFD